MDEKSHKVSKWWTQDSSLINLEVKGEFSKAMDEEISLW